MLHFILIISLSCGADAATSHMAISRQLAKEHNPLLPNQPWAIDAVQAGAAVATIEGVRRIRTEHPRWAWVLAGAVAGVHTWAAIHNLREMRR